MAGFKKVLDYTWIFYSKRLALTVLFSIPALVAFLIPIFVAAPSYVALGGVFIRTGSVPDISQLNLAITIFSYLISLFLIADSLVNINLLIKSKRTQTTISSEIFSGLTHYATKILYVFTIVALLIFVFQLATFDILLQSILFPLLLLALSLLTFFVAPAIVIDNMDTMHALWASYQMLLRKGLFVLYWILLGFALLSIVGLVSFALLPSSIASFLTLIINSLFIFPFLTVLQTQIYMEKYPLAH
ncbi:hypothetical protein HYT84_01450 [Candidatus Micrarchaeota archaeon]|nr:hypothetical protein [Candidatus Micrarchaeota archaeon]